MSTVVPFNEESVMGHLDVCIALWRKRQERAKSDNDFASEQIAISYIDAYQSMRVALFGELLPHPDIGDPMKEVAEEWMGGDKAATIPNPNSGTIGDPNR